MLAAKGQGSVIQRRRALEPEEYKPANAPKDDNGADVTFTKSKAYYDASLASGTALLGKLAAWRNDRAQGQEPQTAKKLKGLGYKHAVKASGNGAEMASGRGFKSRDHLLAKAPYRNRFDRDGVFGAEYNMGPEDTDDRKILKQRERARSSEIIFHQYKLAAEALGLKVAGGLREIHRLTIRNGRTQHAIFWSDHGADDSGTPHAAEGDDRAALLGTPNGNSAAHLLLQHGAEIGALGIQSVEYSRNTTDSEMRIRLELEE